MFAILGFDVQRVLHRQVQSDERAEGLGDRDGTDVVGRTRVRSVCGDIAHETDILVITIRTYPGRVTAEGTDRVLTGVGVRQGDGLEVIAHPR